MFSNGSAIQNPKLRTIAMLVSVDVIKCR